MLRTEIIEFIETHLDEQHESSYKRGSSFWTSAKWRSIILNKFEFEKGEFRTYKGLIEKEVGRIKSQKL